METSTPQPANTAGSSNNSMGIIIALLVIIILGAGGFMYYSRNNASTQPATGTPATTTNTTSQETTNTTTVQEPSGAMTAEASPGAVMAEKVFTIEGDSFTFTPNVMNVKKGDKIKVIFKNNEGFHDWVLDEFNAKTKQIAAGQTDTIEFVADKAGTFEFYCSVGNHRAQGMVGTLTVTE